MLAWVVIIVIIAVLIAVAVYFKYVRTKSTDVIIEKIDENAGKIKVEIGHGMQGYHEYMTPAEYEEHKKQMNHESDKIKSKAQEAQDWKTKLLSGDVTVPAYNEKMKSLGQPNLTI